MSRRQAEHIQHDTVDHPPRDQRSMLRGSARDSGATHSLRSVVTSPGSQQRDPVERSTRPNSTQSSGQSFFRSSRNVEINRSNFRTSHGHRTNLTINLNSAEGGYPSEGDTASHTSQSSRLDRQSSSFPQQHLAACESSMVPPLHATQRSSEIYAWQLTPKGRGFALWIPEPHRNLPKQDRRVGVRIGDVGIITPRGSFSPLFNILDPVPPSRLREGPFPSPLLPDAIEVCELSEFRRGSYLASSAIEKLECDLASGMSFKMSASEGAVLAMPEGATSEDVENVGCIREYVTANLTTWYRYVNGPRRRDARNGDIRVVIGCDKATSSGMAVMTNTTQEVNCQLNLRSLRSESNSDGPISTYIWEHSGLAEVRAGPDNQEIEELRNGDQSPPEDGKYRNQCLFLRTMNPKLGEEEWLALCRELNTPQLVDSSHNKSANHDHNGHDSRWNDQPSSSGSPSSGGNRVHSHPPSIRAYSSSEGSLPFHPSEVINGMLFTKIPEAKMVITEDSNWYSIFNESNDTLPCEEELIKRVLEIYHIEEDNGVVFLRSKNSDKVSAISSSQSFVRRSFPREKAHCSEIPRISSEFDSHTLRSKRGAQGRNVMNETEVVVIDRGDQTLVAGTARPENKPPRPPLKVQIEDASYSRTAETTARAQETRPEPPTRDFFSPSRAAAKRPERLESTLIEAGDDSWAPRPPAEHIYEHLERFFPRHDLYKFVVESSSGDISPNALEPTAALPPPATVNVEKARIGAKKSIRIVAQEYKRKVDQTSRAADTASYANNMLRKRNTKLWGSRLEEVTTAQMRSTSSSPIPESPSGGPTKFQWVRGELIGKGTYGRVYLALNATTGEMIAVKQVELPQTASVKHDSRQHTVVQALKMESETLRDLDHPNIVQYLGFEETPSNLSIFLEYVPGGSVGSCLHKHGKFEDNVTRSFTRQILSGLEYLHSKGILHRDLKADNILVEMSGVCKISDFGLSQRTEDIQGGAFTAMQGNVFWMAPEVINTQKGDYNLKIDIWSVGCVVLEMWQGGRPWMGEEAVAVMFKLYRTKEPPPVNEDVVLSEEADDFRRKCFAINPEERPSAAELRKHDYLTLPPDWVFSGFT